MDGFAQTEVVDNTTPLNTATPITVGVAPVRWDGATTFQSPFFWLILGFTGGLVVCYMARNGKL